MAEHHDNMTILSEVLGFKHKSSVHYRVASGCGERKAEQFRLPELETLYRRYNMTPEQFVAVFFGIK